MKLPLPPIPASFKYPVDDRKPSVPRKEEKPVMGITTSKNFITANAVEAILQVPQGVGEVQPDYLKKADYGKSPAYLEQVKEEIRRENEMIDAYVAEMGRQQDPAGFAEGEQLEPFSEDERRDLVRSLKRKWDATNAKYQRMCHMTKLDTVGKVKRKEALEEELSTLEKDLEKLERPGPVYLN